MSSSNGPSPVLVWYRRDLRIADHPALAAAAESGRAAIPVYILDDAPTGAWRIGGASRWWLDGSLRALAADLEQLGSRLTLRRGPMAQTLMELARETGADAVYFTRHHEPLDASDERALATAAKAAGIECRRFGGNLLHEPETLHTKAGTPFKVFTPFYRAALAGGALKSPLAPPARLRPAQRWPATERLADWRLRPSAPDWAAGLAARWTPGGDAAAARLEKFLANTAASYSSDRDRPDRDGTSALSPYLHFGEIGPRQVWQTAAFAAETAPGARAGIEAFLRQLVWRDFSSHLLHHWPHMADHAFNPAFERFPWREDLGALRAWQTGRTGYPIVDAGMRQLWRTGWMPGRVRMIAASFLTKHLLLPWQAGAAWFWDTLVDADLANNAASWQWVAGSGADAAPYFRVFNPITQGRKFDPNGDYVREWLPQLAHLPAKTVHAPWEATEKTPDYPAPIVEHRAGRERALVAYKRLRDGL